MGKLVLINISLLLLAGSSVTTRCLFNINEQKMFRRHHSIQTIARKIRGEFYLKSVCLNRFMDDPLVTKMIRQTLVNYRILSESDALLVSADHVRLTNSSRHPL